MEKNSPFAAGSGILSGLGTIGSSWAVCHNICMSLVGVFAVVGITVTGMPLAFLLDYAWPLTILGMAATSMSGFFFVRKLEHCGGLKGKWDYANAGLLGIAVVALLYNLWNLLANPVQVAAIALAWVGLIAFIYLSVVRK